MSELPLKDQIKLIEETIKFFNDLANGKIDEIENSVGPRKHKNKKVLEFLKRRITNELKLVERIEKENE